MKQKLLLWFGTMLVILMLVVGPNIAVADGPGDTGDEPPSYADPIPLEKDAGDDLVAPMSVYCGNNCN